MGRFLFTGLGLIALLLTGVLAINQLDQPLKPEVARVLNQTLQTNETQKQAYALLLENKDVFRKTPGPNENLTPTENLKANAKPIADYVRLMEFGDVAPNSDPALPEQPLEQISLVPPQMHSHFLLQLTQWREKGGGARVLDLLQASNHYMKAAMENGTLLDRMIAVRNMRNNGEFLAAQLKIQPKLAKEITADLVSSFSTPPVNDMMAGAMDSELRVLNAYLSVISRKEYDFDASTTDPWEYLTMQFEKAIHHRLFLRPHQTLNDFYILTSESLATDCPMVEEGAETNCLPSWGTLNSKKPWNAVVNPTGKYLVKLVGGGYVFRKQKLQKNVTAIYEFRKSLSL